MIPFICDVQNWRIYKNEMRISGCSLLGSGRRCDLEWVHGFFGRTKTFIVGIIARPFEYTKNHRITRYKRVAWMVSDLYLN